MTIYDAFDSPDAIFNDPNELIHTSVQAIDTNPDENEYKNMLLNLDESEYPFPNDGILHNGINPAYPKLNPVLINNK